MDLKDYFLQGIEFLNSQKEFENVLIKGEVMRAIKKNSYYSTIHFKGYEKDRNKLYGEATIYVNFRDLTTKRAIIKALAHEANHITPIKVGEGYYLNLLREYFNESRA